MGEKKGRKRSKKTLEMNLQISPNFGLCARAKAKYFTIYNRVWFKI